MNQAAKPSDGSNTFPENAIIIRAPAALTGSFVLCDSHNGHWGRNNPAINGDIPISKATEVTFWLDAVFNTATSIEIKPVFLQGRREDDGGRWTNLESTELSDWLTVTDADTGGNFTGQMRNQEIFLSSGTNIIAGRYRIKSVTDSNTIVLEEPCGDTGDATSGVGVMLGGEFQDCFLSDSILPGLRTINPYTTEIVLASTSGKYTFTLPLPAASWMRVYAKANGTVTGTDLALGVTFTPPGGV